MVDERVTDGKRVAQLLASELAGRTTGPLAAVDVVDADPDADPTPEGTVAYRVAVRDERVATVVLYLREAVLRVDSCDDAVLDRAREAGLPAAVETGDAGERERVVVRVGDGAAVKRAVDTLAEGTLR